MSGYKVTRGGEELYRSTTNQAVGDCLEYLAENAPVPVLDALKTGYKISPISKRKFAVVKEPRIFTSREERRERRT